MSIRYLHMCPLMKSSIHVLTIYLKITKVFMRKKVTEMLFLTS